VSNELGPAESKCAGLVATNAVDERIGWILIAARGTHSAKCEVDTRACWQALGNSAGVDPVYSFVEPPEYEEMHARDA
jgi:hypothetical protein